MSELQPATANSSEVPNVSALFGRLVMQQSNMAMMMLGKVAHPETGEVVQDLEAAKLFIDQLEMLEEKTKGNLNKEESTLLKQSLMALRLAFVEAVETPAQPETKSQTHADQSQSATSPPTAPPNPAATAAEDEHRVRFSKKY
jgi:hypothetical protein